MRSNSKQRKVRLTATAAAVLAVAWTLSACSQAGNEQGEGKEPASQAASNGPFPISMALNFDGKDIPKQDNPVQASIEKYTNTKLNLQFFPGKQYEEKLSILIASGDMPQVVASYGPPKQSYLMSAFQTDVFWDISPYIKDYPNLSSLNKAIYDNVAFEGKIYGLPRERPLARTAFIYRTDWLSNAGLKEPQTIDDFYNMLKAFTLNDPDKNGNNDTYGMSTWGAGNFGVFYGAPNVWDMKDGKFIRDVLTPEYLEGLQFEKRLFSEKLIHPDFSIMDRPQFEGEFENSKAGVIYNTTNAAVKYETQLRKSVPNATIDFFSILSASKGKRVAGTVGSNGILMFPKSSVKSEADLKRILKFFDQLAEAPMANLLEWGIEGTNYQNMDGKAEVISTNDDAGTFKAVLRVVASGAKSIPGNVNPLVTREAVVTTDNQKYLINNPANSLVSQTFVERGAELEQIITDANIKFVMGKLDEAGWKSEMERWRKNGGDQIAKEYLAEWEKGQKK